MELSEKELKTLRHMLGINTPQDSKPEPYRNYFCASKDNEHLQELEQKGAVYQYNECDHYKWYRCTEEGKLFAMRSHKDIRYPKAKRKYLRFLDIRDAIPDLTFKQFLTEDRFKKDRAIA